MFWELICVATVAGIWQRYIEPNLLSTTKLSFSIENLPSAIEGFTILQLSDLHFSSATSSHFLNRILRHARKCNPDMIVFTGDFLNYAHLENEQTLLEFLCGFDAPYGCFAVLGNHDYQHYVTLNDAGDYDVAEPTKYPWFKGMKRLFKNPRISGRVTEAAQTTPLNAGLVDVLQQSPFTLIHNETKHVRIGDSELNLTGLGEYTLGRTLSSIAFQEYEPSFPGVVLTHNPDSIPLLLELPGNVILSGHTHGAQINLPWIWKRFTLIENLKYKRGHFTVDGKEIYVNRGLGGVLPIRWFSTPEMLLLTLRKKS